MKSEKVSIFLDFQAVRSLGDLSRYGCTFLTSEADPLNFRKLVELNQPALDALARLLDVYAIQLQPCFNNYEGDRVGSLLLPKDLLPSFTVFLMAHVGGCQSVCRSSQSGHFYGATGGPALECVDTDYDRRHDYDMRWRLLSSPPTCEYNGATS